MHRRFYYSLVVLLMFLTPQIGGSQTRQEPGAKTKIGDFEPTFYRIVDEKSREFADQEKTEEILSHTDEVLSVVAPSFKEHLDIEGSGRLADGRVVNIRGHRNGVPRYSVVDGAPFGLAENDESLVPYHSLAVDPDVIPLGTVVYIPAIKGIRLPGGEVHNGLFLAHDTGSAIKGNRIDIFVGFENDVRNSLTLSDRVDSFEPLEIYTVDDRTADQFLNDFFTHRN